MSICEGIFTGDGAIAFASLFKQLREIKTGEQQLKRSIRLFTAVLWIGWANVAVAGQSPALNAYAGRYAAGPLEVAAISVSGDSLIVSPPYWQSAPMLAPVEDQADTFFFSLPEVRPDRRVRFQRDLAGDVVGFRTEGVEARIDALGEFRRLPDGAITPIDRILRGEVLQGAAEARQAGATDQDLLAVATRLLQRYPSRAAIAEGLLVQLAAAEPQSASIQVLLGDAQIALGQRDRARTAYGAAIAREPGQADALLGLARLDDREPLTGEGYRRFFPYPLEALFAPPTAAEIAAVRDDWASRDLAPRDVVEIGTVQISIRGVAFVAHVLRHTVHAQSHVSVVFVPATATRPLPVIIDARGVDPDFTPLDLDLGSRAMRQLGAASERFVFVVPAFRGETLVLAGQSYRAAGDPANGWDGATDDAIASLSVALERIPVTDAERVIAFGQSRGGTIALLLGIRDTRIDLVFAQAAPADWFSAMDQGGWRTADILRAALADGVPPAPREAGGQFYQRVIQPVHEGRLDLASTRLRMLASSPAWFAGDLGHVIALYGEEDRSVPVANAQVMDAALRGKPGARVVVFPERGHDLDINSASILLTEAVREIEGDPGRSGGSTQLSFRSRRSDQTP